MGNFQIVTTPTRIPVPGNKLIEEFFGHANTKTSIFSLAHMMAPPGWSEPPQTPEFGELTLMIRGRMRLEIDGKTLELEAGQAIWIEPRVLVRYSNPFPEANEYWAFCLPAFSPDLAHRSA